MKLVVEPFIVQVSQEEVDDLRARLANTRWPDQIPGSGWDYGTDLGYLRQLCEYWRSQYDWDGFVARCNTFPQAQATIDDTSVHFVHARSPEADARPLLLVHGWPGSVAEFHQVLGPLSDPRAHGGDPKDAFHVVAPSLPGYGFSGPTMQRGWDGHRVARALGDLMVGLGYPRFYAQGGDWGSMITTSLAGQQPDRVAGLHVNLLMTPPPEGPDANEGLTQADFEGLARMQQFFAEETGYQAIQATKPQSLAYGLTDSPAGLAGWIVEKLRRWSDCDGDVEQAFTKDQILDDISIYWLTGTIGSSMRLYYETLGPGRYVDPPPLTVPLGHAQYPREIYYAPRKWAEAAYDIAHWAEMPRGGHFAAMEVPDLFVDDVRTCFRAMPAI